MCGLVSIWSINNGNCSQTQRIVLKKKDGTSSKLTCLLLCRMMLTVADIIHMSVYILAYLWNNNRAGLLKRILISPDNVLLPEWKGVKTLIFQFLPSLHEQIRRVQSCSIESISVWRRILSFWPLCAGRYEVRWSWITKCSLQLLCIQISWR